MQALPDYPPNPRLIQQLRYLIEVDKVKAILRKSKLFDGSRFENDAEHSWTIAIMAVLLREHANFPVDLERALTMLLIHDIVEIDAGDSFLYGAERADAHAKERLAAERIFGMLEPTQRDHFLQLWEEFEARDSNEAKFASVFDRMEPILQNYVNEGFTWKQNHVTYEMVMAKNHHIAEGSQAIWAFVQFLLDEAVHQGYLPRGV
jgi:putative hydrolase of HD superfamily